MPIHPKFGRAFVNSDELIYPEFFLEFFGGVAGPGDWIGNSAPYLPQMAIMGVTMSLTDGDFRAAMAAYSLALALSIALALALVVRQAGGLSFARSAVAALVATSLLALAIRYGGSWMGAITSQHRPLSVVMFLLVAWGLAKVVAGDRDLHPALLAYLAACLFFGVSDALFLFQVAVPVLLVALAWWMSSPRSGKARALLSCAALGCVLVYLGRVALIMFNPFLLNESGQEWEYDPLEWVYWLLEPFGRDGLLFIIVHMFESTARRTTEIFYELYTGDNWPTNLLLSCCALALAPWLSKGRFSRAVASHGATEPGEAIVSVLAGMVLALFASLYAMFLFTKFIITYSWPLLWIPPLALAVVWAHSHRPGASVAANKAARLCAPAITAIAVAGMAADLALFRHDDFVSHRVACHERIVEGNGLSRGIVPYWHNRQVRMLTGQQENDILFYVYKNNTSLYYHVGNVSQTKGHAGYAVTDAEHPWAVESFSKSYGLPALIAACASERYLIYRDGHMSGEKI